MKCFNFNISSNHPKKNLTRLKTPTKMSYMNAQNPTCFSLMGISEDIGGFENLTIPLVEFHTLKKVCLK